MFFPGILCWLLLCGCRGRQAPEYDHLQSQLLAEVFEALAGDNAARTTSLLQRYLDRDSGNRFARLALAHEHERRIVQQLNEALAGGDTQAVDAIFRHAAEDGQTYRVLAEFRELPRALGALRQYLQQRPFATSAEMQAARDRLLSQSAQLERSPAFADFLQQQQHLLEALQAEEAAQAVQVLVQELDLAAVSGHLPADMLLADLGARAPQHPVYQACRVVRARDWEAFRDMALEALDTGASFAALEVAACLHWTVLNDRERRVVGKLFAAGNPETLSGTLLRGWQGIAAGDAGDGTKAVRELLQSLTPRAELAATFLTRCVLPAEQFAAWCWRSPAPGVIDMLGRIEQVKHHTPKP